MKDEATQELAKLGLTEYQSKVYSALTSLGPSGATEINRFSGVPRTKVYETLQELISRGCVEFQPGRPALYRSVRPMILIKMLTEGYMSSAQKAERLLEGQYETVHDLAEDDLVWIVRGNSTIRRKLAELLASAKRSILILETYPPAFIPSVKSILRATSNNGLVVKAMCVVTEKQATFEFPEPDLIHYKALSLSESRKGRGQPHSSFGRLSEDPFLKPLGMTFSSPYGVAIVDDSKALVMMQNTSDQTRSIGFSAKIPGIPAILSVMFDRLFTLGKRIDAGP